MACTCATMTVRERFHAVMNRQAVDRLPLLEWAGWWDKTIQRWEGEGLPKDLGCYGVKKYFGQDLYFQDWVRIRHSGLPEPACHGAGIISNEEEYERIRPYIFNMPDDEREPALQHDLWQRNAQLRKTGEAVSWFTLEGFFWFPRTLFGIEPHLYAFYDQPELMHRINNELADWMLKIIDAICGICVPDFMTFAEDMSYNNGPMLSKELFDEFMLPYYRRVVPALRERGIRVFVDSDGDITKCASWFTEAGIEGILPLERQAGVDMEVLRRDNPDQLYLGAFDKMTMSRGSEAMRAEFERLLPVARQGGFIISVDHQTPPEVSLENYREFMNLFREYASRV